MGNSLIAFRPDLKIHVMSAELISLYHYQFPKSDYAVIIITSHPERLMPVTKSHNWLALDFLDVDSCVNPKAMQEGHGEMIKTFLDSLGPEISDLYVCCDSGESRSPAIAAGILLYLGMDDNVIWRNPYYFPNLHVYQVTCKAFGIIKDKNLLKINRNIHMDALAALKKGNNRGYSRIMNTFYRL